MLELFFKIEEAVKKIEIERGVGWQFCMLYGSFNKYGQVTCFKDGMFEVKNKWITFLALDDMHTIYEVKLSAAQKGEIRFKSSFYTPLPSGSPLKKFENEDREIDMQAFLNHWNRPEKMLISEHVWEYKGDIPYTETLEMEVDRERDALRFYVTVIYRPWDVQPDENRLYKETGREIKTITLDNEITLEFERHTTMKAMKQVMEYCEKNNLPISVRREDYMMPGHCIDIPYMIVETERFKIAFEFENIDMVCITKNIMDGSCYTDASGAEYNIGALVREIHEDIESGTYVRDHGATNICKRVYSEDDEYIFGCWFC